MAVTIRYKKTGKTEQVTRNVAFDLIERGVAERVYEKDAKGVAQQPTGYAQREMVDEAHTSKHPESIEEDDSPDKPQRGYKNRQMRPTTK